MINNRWNSDRQQSKMTYNQLHNGLKSPKTQEKRLKTTKNAYLRSRCFGRHATFALWVKALRDKPTLPRVRSRSRRFAKVSDEDNPGEMLASNFELNLGISRAFFLPLNETFTANIMAFCSEHPK